MSLKKTLYSKKFFILNLVFLGIIGGFALALVIFNSLGTIEKPEEAYALDGTSYNISQLEGLEASFRGVAADVLPTVVQVDVVEITTQDERQQFPYEFFFGEEPSDEPGEREYRNEGLGSGVIVRKSGRTVYVLTNNHVAGNADEISVTLYNNDTYPAELVGNDSRTDLALLKFTTSDSSIKTAEIGDSDTLSVGDWVLAVGNPYGYFSSVTAGIVSGMGRTGPTEVNEYIQTDASINQGNSGGALVNLKGELVGINTWIATPTGTNIGLGFASPVNDAVKVIDDFITYGEVQYGWLGVSHLDRDSLPDEFIDALDTNTQEGVFVQSLYLDSPAYKGGIRAGDFIVSVDGLKIKDQNDIARYVGYFKAGEKVEIELYRNGKLMSVSVTIGNRNEATKSLLDENLWPGMLVTELNDDLRDDLDISSWIKGVVVANIRDRTKAYTAGLKPGDVITKIERTSIKSLLDFYEQLNSYSSGTIKITYIREGETETTELNLN